MVDRDLGAHGVHGPELGVIFKLGEAWGDGLGA